MSKKIILGETLSQLTCMRSEAAELMYKDFYGKNEYSWCLVPSNVFDLADSDEVGPIQEMFKKDVNKKMQSIFTLSLVGILFRPHKMDDNDFCIIREAITAFSEDIEALSLFIL